MMEIVPSRRPKIEDILKHPFMQGEYARKEEVQVELARRKEIAYANAHNQADRAKQQAQIKAVKRRNSYYEEDETEETTVEQNS